MTNQKPILFAKDNDISEIERLLSESGRGDCFGPPPANLVPRAMVVVESHRTPCKPASRRNSALVVLSLAAAGLVLAAIGGPKSQPEARPTQAIVRAEAEAEAKPKRTAKLSQVPASTPAITVNPGLRKGVPLRKLAFVRRLSTQTKLGLPEHPTPPRAIWTSTVVRSSEQGLVVPVVAQGDSPGPADGMTPAVAVVPLRSGVSYIEYPADGAP